MKAKWKFATCCIVLVLLLSLVCFVSDVLQGSRPEMRLTLLHYWASMTPEKIDEHIQLAKDMNCNTLIFPTYAHGKAMYNSTLVPKWAEIQQSGFDPLAYATRRCHEEGLLIHAWLLTYYSGLWSKLEIPGYYPSEHVLITHPEWITQGVDVGYGSPYDGVWLDPGVPQVKDYLRSVMQEVCSYNIDGVFLDYIRYETASQGYNPFAVAEFEAQHGYTPSNDHDLVWRQWRMDQVTDLVSLFADYIHSQGSDKWLGAAASGNYQNGYDWCLQDSVEWMEKGLVDYIAVMGATTDNTVFTSNNQFYLENCYGRYVLPIVAVYRFEEINDPTKVAGQMQLARDLGMPGMCIFSLNEINGKQSYIDAVKDVFSVPALPLPKPSINHP